MSAFLEALSTHAFLQHALAAGVLASVACGIVGSYVVVKRIGYLAGGIAHTVLGGMGIAYFLGKSPIGGALGAALLAAAIIGWVSLRLRQHEDTIIGALWAVGMALGLVFISRTPGYNADLMSYLFGSILMVPREDLLLMAALDGVIVVLVLLFRKPFLAVCFDEEFARLRGVPVDVFYLVLLCMVALTVVILIQVVGLVLVIALLTLPAAIAGQYARSLAVMMLVATLLGIVFTGAGLALSYEPDLPAGATIVLLAGTVYLLLVAGRGLYLYFSGRRARGIPATEAHKGIIVRSPGSLIAVAPGPREPYRRRIAQAWHPLSRFSIIECRSARRSGGEELLQVVDEGLHAIGFVADEDRVAGAVEYINDVAVGHLIVSARVRSSQAVAHAVAPGQLLQLLCVAAQAHELGAEQAGVLLQCLRGVAFGVDGDEQYPHPVRVCTEGLDRPGQRCECGRAFIRAVGVAEVQQGHLAAEVLRAHGSAVALCQRELQRRQKAVGTGQLPGLLAVAAAGDQSAPAAP